MHETVFFNQQFLLYSDAKISAISSAALYGRGVFTTVAIKERKAFLWEKHWRRLNENAAKIGVDLSGFSEDLLVDALDWSFETEKKTNVLMTTAALRELPESFRLSLSPFPVNSASPLAHVKSCNYLESILALEEARKRGFDEAIRLNEKNEIVSASAANIFWISDEKIFTPALTTGCLAGTTREFITENFPVCEKTAEPAELIKADEIFLTSAGIGICPAHYESTGNTNYSMISKLKKILDLL